MTRHSLAKMKTAKIVLSDVKDPDLFHELVHKLKIPRAVENRHFAFGEYASLEIEVNAKLEIVGGRFLPIE